jgi:hypothetical protein
MAIGAGTTKPICTFKGPVIGSSQGKGGHMYQVTGNQLHAENHGPKVIGNQQATRRIIMAGNCTDCSLFRHQVNYSLMEYFLN